MTEDNGKTFEAWIEKYEAVQQCPPKEGDILKPADGKAILVVELAEGSPPFIYGRVYVPETVGCRVGWFLQSSESQGFHGWKCILMPRARTELIRKFGVGAEIIEIASLRVVRLSHSGKSLLCEVHEYCPEEEEVIILKGEKIVDEEGTLIPDETAIKIAEAEAVDTLPGVIGINAG